MTPSLQDGIDKAGSPIQLLWKPGAPNWSVPVVEPEYAGWAQEQEAWRSGVTIADLSFHMSDTVIEGPDATKLLSETSANNYEQFAIGQAKQFVPVAPDGNIIVDGILLREAEQRYNLSGVPAAQNWVKYHAERGGYRVEYSTNADSSVRNDADPALFRFQIQGPLALELVARAFGGPLPETKFFHSSMVTLAGAPVRALRHGMAGQAGFEFIGDYVHYDLVKEALMAAGADLGIVHIGGLSYFTNGIESGWIPSPTPAIYTDPSLLDYRKWVSLFSYEGQKPLHGSFYSPNIEDYYTSPWELGYGRSVSFNHDFIGRDALMAARDTVHRQRVTLEWNREDLHRVFGGDPGYLLSYARHRIEGSAGLVGLSFYTGNIAPVGTVLSLSLVDASVAMPGTELELVWGEHPGAGIDPKAEMGFERIRVTVQPSPYDEYARSSYRKDVV